MRPTLFPRTLLTRRVAVSLVPLSLALACDTAADSPGGATGSLSGSMSTGGPATNTAPSVAPGTTDNGSPSSTTPTSPSPLPTQVPTTMPPPSDSPNTGGAGGGGDGPSGDTPALGGGTPNMSPPGTSTPSVPSSDPPESDAGAGEEPELPSEDAGTPPDETPVTTPGMQTSAGCGKDPSLQSGSGTIDVDGTSREYILKIPDGYDPAVPYKLVFGLHWLGGQASDVSGGTIGLGNYYGLEDLAEGSTIFIAPNGIDNGWPNTGGRDIAFMKALIELLGGDLCIDLERVFSVGFSYGGMMSFAIACEMADVFRAIAPLSGALYSGCGNGTEPIAMWGAHGISDDVVPIGDGRTGLQEVLDRNNCGTETTPTSPDSCVTYEGCDEGYPVTWCEFDGGHSPQQWQSQPIWDFFSQF
jgi:polyhydroxybutyrate depolymerase